MVYFTKVKPRTMEGLYVFFLKKEGFRILQGTLGIKKQELSLAAIFKYVREVFFK